MRRAAALLLTVVGGYMFVDGVRALTVGDYLTPSGGDHAGQLGPWADLLEAVGVPPRSTATKLALVGLGAFHLVGAVSTLRSPRRAVPVAAAIGGVWYAPFGTILDLLVLVLLGRAGRAGRDAQPANTL
jgi:hypothetical protein